MSDPDSREALERIAAAQERQAAALEVVAGMLMLEFDSREGRPDYTVEALFSEALFHGTGGDSA